MEKMKGVIIDDAHNNINVLNEKIKKYCPSLEVKATYTNPEIALLELPKINYDVLFLDIEMPEMDGFMFLQELKPSAKVVFVTAYNHYAIKAIRANAFDYLEKPIDVTELKNTVLRISESLKLNSTENTMPSIVGLIADLKNNNAKSQSNKISLFTNDGIFILQLAEIIRLESDNNYTKFHLKDGKKLLVSKTMGEFENTLLSNDFYRIHRSHIINLHHLKVFNKGLMAYAEMSDGSKVEVSDKKRKEFQERIAMMVI